MRTPSLAARVVLSRQRQQDAISNGFWKRDKRGRFAETSGGPGSGEDLLAAGRGEEVAQAALDAAGGEVTGRRLYNGGQAPGIGPHGDEALHAIVAQQGFDGPATVVSRKELSRGVRDGDAEMFRGVQGGKRADGKTAEEIHEQTRSGEDYQGLGAFGNGTYFSGSESMAATYGTTARFALAREARTADYDTLRTEQESYLKTVSRDSAAYRVFSDPGRYAAARGYDAIHVRREGQPKGGENEYVVLNRTALIAEAP